jgi:hypothetical protein
MAAELNIIETHNLITAWAPSGFTACAHVWRVGSQSSGETMPADRVRTNAAPRRKGTAISSIISCGPHSAIPHPHPHCRRTRAHRAEMDVALKRGSRGSRRKNRRPWWCGSRGARGPESKDGHGVERAESCCVGATDAKSERHEVGGGTGWGEIVLLDEWEQVGLDPGHPRFSPYNVSPWIHSICCFLITSSLLRFVASGHGFIGFQFWCVPTYSCSQSFVLCPKIVA